MIRNSYFGATMPVVSPTLANTTGSIADVLVALVGGAAPVTIPAIPAATTEFTAGLNPNARKVFNFLYSPYIVISMTVNTAGNSTARFAIQYSTDQVTWNFLGDGTTAWDAVSLASTGDFRVGFFVSDACRYAGQVFCRPVTLGGNGVANPAIGGTNGCSAIGFYRALFSITRQSYPLLQVLTAASATTSRPCYATRSFNNFTNATWNAMPNALTEYLGDTLNRRAQNFKLFATNWVAGSWTMAVAGSAAATYKLQWSQDGGTVWNFADLSANPTGAINGTGCKVFVPWATAIAPSFYTNANAATSLRRWAGAGGNGVANPAFASINQDLIPFFFIDPNGVV